MLLASIAVYLTLEWWLWPDVCLTFEAEHDGFFSSALDFITTGKLHSQGAPLGPFALHHGPVLYLVLALPMLVSTSLAWLHLTFLLCAAAAGLVLFQAMGRRASPAAAAFVIFCALSSYFAHEFSRQLWHSSLLPLPIAGLLLATIRLGEAGRLRDGLIAAALAGFMVQLHVQSVVYVPLVLGVALIKRKELGWRGLALGVAMFLAVSSPMWLGFFTQSGAEVGSQLSEQGAKSGGFVADPLVVVTFLMEAVTPVWGPALAPGLGVPIFLLGLWGLLVAIRERAVAGLIFAAAFVIGLVAEHALLRYMVAPRYLHAVLWPFYGLVAIGLESALQRFETYRAGAVAALLLVTLAVSVDGLRSPAPMSVATPLLSGPAQARLAALVAPKAPGDLAHERVHGLYVRDLRHLLGMGFLHRAASPASTANQRHILVPIPGLTLQPHALGKPSKDGPLIFYRPAIEGLSAEGPAADRVLKRWADSRAPAAEMVHTIRFKSLAPGTVTVVIRGPDCPTRGLNGGPPSQFGTIYRLPVGVGETSFQVGPCRGVPAIDVF